MISEVRQRAKTAKVAQKYDTFEVQGFRLGVRPEVTPPVLVAALRPGMLRLAGREADGAIINWLSADDVAKVEPVWDCVGADEIAAGASGEDRELDVCPAGDPVHDLVDGSVAADGHQ